MEKNHYQIVAKTPEDWKVVHKLLMQDGTLEDNIPERSIECVNDIKHSKTRSTYLMTDDEAELLRQSDRILLVDLDIYYHPESAPKIEPYIKRFGKSVRNYRSLRRFNQSKDSCGELLKLANDGSTVNAGYWEWSIPYYQKFDPRFSAEQNRVGYQILRCTSEQNQFSSNSLDVKFQDIDYSTDGTDIDVIVVDNGFFYGHPEFTASSSGKEYFDPPNYVYGNVLSRHGRCGLLDLVLDAPYYLDPEWFDVDPINRLEKRWDGTTVPKEQVARDWWSGPQFRSSSFPDFGSIPIPQGYTRKNTCGENAISVPPAIGAFERPGDHGTPCASLTYGKNFGWAFNSNKWTLTLGFSSSGLLRSIDQQSVFDIQKIFHKYKPVNPKFGTKNPTVSSNSWGTSSNISLILLSPYSDPVLGYPYADPSKTDTTGRAFYKYRTTSGFFNFKIKRDNDIIDQSTGKRYKKLEIDFQNSPEIPKFLSSRNKQFELFFEDASYLIAGKELISSGVHFVCAGGNSSSYLGTPTDEDFDNIFENSAGEKFYFNRPGYPAQIGYTDGQTERFKTFIIGAIDDEYTGSTSIESFSGIPQGTPPARFQETNSTYLSAGTGKERLARADDYLGSNWGVDYSTKGSGIDFYAPGDGTLTAGIRLVPIIDDPVVFPPQEEPIPRFDSCGNPTRGTPVIQDYQSAVQPEPSIVYHDQYFNGTSAATPVAAGLIACFCQNNRDMNSVDLKTYLRNNIQSQSSSNFFIGTRPGDSPNDSAWEVPFSVMGRAVKIIKEVTTRNGTPNPSFTSTYGIASNFGANERFIITNSSSLIHKIEILGIKKFDENAATYELNIKTGYYKVGARSELTYDKLKTIKLRVDPSNSKKLQLTDSDGTYGWDDMEITAFNGEFKQVSTEVYYVFSGGVLPGNQAYVGSGAAGPAYVPPAPGGGTITGGGDLIVTGDIVAGDDIIGLVSDERLKENIKPIENALDKLEKLDGFTYNFNEIGERLGFDPNKRHSGVSAQIVKNVLPEASAPAPADNDYLTVKYDKLIPLLIESIKDLKDDIDDIKKNDGK